MRVKVNRLTVESFAEGPCARPTTDPAMPITLARIVLFSLLMLPLAPLQAAAVEVGGQAELRFWGVEQARRAALKDAVKRASELGWVERAARVVRAADQGEGTLPREGDGYRIVSQEIDDGWIYLVVELELRSAQRCERLSHYRKKVAVTAFPMARAAQGRGNEVSFFEQGVPRALGRRLTRKGLYRVAELAPSHPFSGVEAGDRPLNHTSVDPAVVVAIGREQGAQAVVTGIVRDVGTEYGDHYEYETPVGEKSFTVDADRRAFELELLVYDAISGNLLTRRTLRERVKGEATLAVDSPSALSDAFLATEYGRALGRLLRHAALTVDFALVCQPFTTRVVRVEGDDIYLDAGSDANVAEGESFEAVITTRDAFSAGAGASTLVEVPAGSLSVVKSAAGFSIGRLKVENALRPGDIVREP